MRYVRNDSAFGQENIKIIFSYRKTRCTIRLTGEISGEGGE